MIMIFTNIRSYEFVPPIGIDISPKIAFQRYAKIGIERQGQKLMIQVFGRMAWSKTNDPHDEVNNLVTFFHPLGHLVHTYSRVV